jgi:hypothetical protein
MLIVYAYDDEADVIAVVTIQDGRERAQPMRGVV